MDVILVSPF